MAVNNLQLINGVLAAAVQTTQYTVLSGITTAIIDKFSVVNISGNNAQITINIVEASGIVGDENKVLDAKTIGPGETYLCPEVVGRAINTGGFISTLASTGSALAIMASGREITPTST